MTLKQWEANPDLHIKLAELLQDPVLNAALDIIQAQGIKPIVPPTGFDLVQYGAMMGFKRDGCIETLMNLRNLALPPLPAGKSELRAWTTEEKPQTPS